MERGVKEYRRSICREGDERVHVVYAESCNAVKGIITHYDPVVSNLMWVYE